MSSTVIITAIICATIIVVSLVNRPGRDQMRETTYIYEDGQLREVKHEYK
jgi:hypothetical protein